MSRRAVLLGALDSAPGDLARLCARVGAESSARPAPGEASIAGVVAHLCEVEACYRAWFETVVAQDVPHLAALPPGPDAERTAQPLAGLVEQFRASRAETTARLRELSPGAWQRRAVSPDGEETTLRWLVQSLVEHDTRRLAQIADIRRQLEPGG